MTKHITVDGVEYAPIATDSPIKIVILQRGWAMVGRYGLDADTQIITLDSAAVIRTWGTTCGLGEIAAGGPTASTKLDPAGRVTAHLLTTVAMLDCNAEAWAGRL